MESGRSFEPDEATRGSQVALLGQTVSRQLFQDQDPIGREVRIRNVPFRVIGMLARKVSRVLVKIRTMRFLCRLRRVDGC